jgi:hypothetical protein
LCSLWMESGAAWNFQPIGLATTASQFQKPTHKLPCLPERPTLETRVKARAIGDRASVYYDR